MFIVFISIITLVLGLLHFVIYKALVAIFVLTGTWKAALGILLAIAGASFIISSFISFSVYNTFARIYYTISAAWLGIATYLFLAACAYAAIALIWRFVAPLNASSSNELVLRVVGVILVMVALGLSVYGLVHARRMVVTRVDVSLQNMPASWSGATAVWVSDLHLGAIYGKSFARAIADRIAELDADVVFIGGDLYDGSAIDMADAISPLADVRPRLGMYFITGNHEEFRDSGEYIDAIRSIGIRPLMNELVDLEGVQLIGVTDRQSIRPELFAPIISGLNIDRARPAILLKHQPSQLDMAEAAGISLQISGHTHRAQIAPLNLFTRVLFKGYDYGLKQFGSMVVFTSSGVGTWGPPMRVGSDSEIVLFTFK